MIYALSDHVQNLLSGKEGIGRRFVGGGGGEGEVKWEGVLAFMQHKNSIYTEQHWHLYNTTLAFIQHHTGIYTFKVGWVLTQ